MAGKFLIYSVGELIKRHTIKGLLSQSSQSPQSKPKTILLGLPPKGFSLDVLCVSVSFSER
jgi:hypothetical protein